jgi:putative GTP pyrophosphokinase
MSVQVRTALQHAWAEVEHDLGYKADAVPVQIRRRFSRIASLLEIADQEFVAIRSELKAYQNQIQQQLGASDVTGANNVQIDEVSLAALVGTAAVVALDQAVAEALQRPCAATDYFPAYLVKMLRCAGLVTSQDLRDALAHYSHQVPTIIDEYFVFSEHMWRFGRDAIPAIERGYGLFFLAHLAILRGPDLMLSRVARLTAMYQQLDDLDAKSAHELANGLLHAFGA